MYYAPLLHVLKRRRIGFCAEKLLEQFNKQAAFYFIMSSSSVISHLKET